MRLEHLQAWLVEAMRKERPDTANWDWVVDIINTVFMEGRLPDECMWQTVVLLPKGNGESRGVRFVEVLWKDLFGVVNLCIGAAAKFHDMLHGFMAGRGTWNASLEDKLLQNLTSTREEVLYEVFLGLWKDYDALDRWRYMYIMVGYGIGLRRERILHY